MSDLFSRTFKSRTRAEWEAVFDGTDACCTPVLTHDELHATGFDQRPIVALKQSPGLAASDSDSDDRPAAEGQGLGVEGAGWTSKGLALGDGGEELLAKWMGWSKGRHYAVHQGGLQRKSVSKL